MKSLESNPLPIPVKRALKKLGRDIKDARLRRRISTELMCKRIYISRPTLNKIENGDPTVSMGAYATALFVLGMIQRLGELADLLHDSVGQILEEESLPKRIRARKNRKLRDE
jgi:transcriptional regulator with XRE-family HTH domain